MDNMDFMDKASAIWKALDEMSANSPEAYANFIQSQLKEGAQLFGGGGSGQKVKSNVSPKKPDNLDHVDPVNGLLKQLSGLNLSPSPSSSMTGRSNKRNESKTNSAGCLADKETSVDEKRGTLLDNDIGGSLLASIVKVKDVEEDEENAEEVSLQLLSPTVGPTKQFSKTETKQSLIQEL